jgi:hypothetical protein
MSGRPPGWLLPTEEEEAALSAAMCGAGGRDGITGVMDGSVDGLPLPDHLAVLRSMRGVLEDAYGSG